MIILTSTTDTIQMLLGGTVATNQVSSVASWRDITTALFTPGRTTASSNNTTAVSVVGAPAASTQRVIDLFNIYNKDTASVTLTVRFNDNGTYYTLWQGVLLTGESLQYIDGAGWTRMNATGYAASSGVSSITGTAGQITASSGTGAITLSLPATITGVSSIASLTTVGALNSGSITSGFGSIDVGTDAISGGAISGTTGGFSGRITSTSNNTTPLLLSGATTGQSFASIQNTSGALYFGTESSAGGSVVSGAGAYSPFLCSHGGQELVFAVSDVRVGGFTSTGLNSTVIGATTPAAGSFTTLSASGQFNVGGRIFALDVTNDMRLYGGSSGWNFYDNVGTGRWAGTNYTTTTIGVVANPSILSITSTGLAVTGALSATGQITSSVGSESIKLTTPSDLSAAGTAYIGFRGTNSAGALYSYIGHAGATNTLGIFTVGAHITIAANSSTVGDFSSTGLAVTGALSATGQITSTAAGLLFSRTGASTAAQYANIASTGGSLYWGINDSSGATFAFAPAYSSIITTGTATDLILAVNSTKIATVSSTGLAVTGTLSATGLLTVGGSTPASAAASGVAGTVTWDASYIYVCIATNTWKRVAIATW